MIQRRYKRKYFRIKPENALHSELRIVRVSGRDVGSRSARIRILNISPGGLKFLSGLDFPVDPCIVLNFRIQVSNQVVCPEGYIVHKVKNEESLYEYGVCFVNVDSSMRYLLVKLFNTVMSQIKNYILIQKFH